MQRGILLLAGLMLMAPVFGWHAIGHKATAAIAWESLTPAAQEDVVRILAAHPRFEEDFKDLMPVAIVRAGEQAQGRWLLEQASIWPDLIQTLDAEIQRQFNKSRWHYINLPIWLTEDDRMQLEGKLEHNMLTEFEPPLRQNLNVIQALRGNLQVWRNTGTSDAEKAVALCWIIHLTGDLHQPLHTVALFSRPYFPTGDRGGNNIEVVWVDATRNMHAVWDGLPTDMSDLKPTPRTLLSVQNDIVDDRAIDEWLRHHASLARKFVYTAEVKAQLLAGLSNYLLPDIRVSREYLISARAIARRQVNLAGHRIAALLQE